MIWVWAAVLHHRTFKHHRLNLHMRWTHRPPILWHHTCWVKLMRRKTAISVQFIITITTLTITRDFLTLTRNTKCLHHPPQMFTSIIRASMDTEWSGKSNTSPDKFHGKLTKTKIFLVVRNLRKRKSFSVFLIKRLFFAHRKSSINKVFSRQMPS